MLSIIEENEASKNEKSVELFKSMELKCKLSENLKAKIQWIQRVKTYVGQ